MFCFSVYSLLTNGPQGTKQRLSKKLFTTLGSSVNAGGFPALQPCQYTVLGSVPLNAGSLSREKTCLHNFANLVLVGHAKTTLCVLLSPVTPLQLLVHSVFKYMLPIGLWMAGEELRGRDYFCWLFPVVLPPVSVPGQVLCLAQWPRIELVGQIRFNAGQACLDLAAC